MIRKKNWSQTRKLDSLSFSARNYIEVVRYTRNHIEWAEDKKWPFPFSSTCDHHHQHQRYCGLFSKAFMIKNSQVLFFIIPCSKRFLSTTSIFAGSFVSKALDLVAIHLMGPLVSFFIFYISWFFYILLLLTSLYLPVLLLAKLLIWWPSTWWASWSPPFMDTRGSWVAFTELLFQQNWPSFHYTAPLL